MDFTGFIEETVADLLASLRDDLRAEYAGPLAVRTVMRALGLEASDPETVLGWYDAFAEGMTEAALGREPPPRSRDAFEAFRATMEPHLTGYDLPREELVSNAALIMFGGIETTESLILNALWLLLTHRDQLALLHEKPELLDNAIEESLRYEAAVASFERFATRDTVLGGVAIAARRPRHRAGRSRQPRPELLPRPGPLRHREGERPPAPRLRRRSARLPRDASRPPGSPRRGRPPPRCVPRSRARRAALRCAPWPRLPQTAVARPPPPLTATAPRDVTGTVPGRVPARQRPKSARRRRLQGISPRDMSAADARGTVPGRVSGRHGRTAGEWSGETLLHDLRRMTSGAP